MNDNESDFCGLLEDCQLGDVVTHLDNRRWNIVGQISDYFQLQLEGEGIQRIILVSKYNEEYYCLGQTTLEEILCDD